MDATCAIQASIHVFSLVRKYVSRILGTYQNYFRDLFIHSGCLLCGIAALTENYIFITIKYAQKHGSHDACCQNLAYSNCSHQKWNRKRLTVSIFQHPRNHQSIQYYRRNRCQIFALTPKHPCQICSHQSGQTSGNHIQHNTATQHVGDQTANKQPRNRSRCKERQYCQCLSHTSLDRTITDRLKYQT